MKIWIEVDDQYLTNQPLVTRRRKLVPDPHRPPNEAWLFCHKMRETKNGLSSSRFIVPLKPSRRGKKYVDREVCKWVKKNRAIVREDTPDER